MITEDIYKKYQQNVLIGNRTTCTSIVKKLLQDGIEIKSLYINLFQRSLYDVGLLWETNKISVAVEHLCTSITESLINLAYPYLFAAEHCGNKAIVMCTPGEHHQVAARMVADYFELNGWDSYFIGKDTPDNELFRFIEDNDPDVLAISVSVFFSISPLQNLVSRIDAMFPKLKIIIGGQGLRWSGEDSFKTFDKVQILMTLDEIDEKIFRK